MSDQPPRVQMCWSKHDRAWTVVVNGTAIGSYPNRSVAERELDRYLKQWSGLTSVR